MMLNAILQVGLLSLGIAASAGSAVACSVPIVVYGDWSPSPGLSEEDRAKAVAAFDKQWLENLDAWSKVRKAEDQQVLWDKADQVFLGRIEATYRFKSDVFADILKIPHVLLRPVRWLKGSGADNAFTLAFTNWSSCGLTPDWDVLRGKVGDTFVIFAAAGAPSDSTVLQGLAPDAALDPRVRAGLAAPQ